MNLWEGDVIRMAVMCNNPLMMKITELSFAMDDLRLFLDTHPDCKEALVYYDEIQRQRRIAVDEYEEKFGPLGFYGNVDCNEWKWVCGPWPWQN